MKGRLITLEGIDGTGKTTQTSAVADWLRARGLPVMTTREPGGTELGEDLREMLCTRKMAPSTELLLMFAARSEHIGRIIGPALEIGSWVVCDRYTDSSYAYQAAGRGQPDARVAALEDWIVAPEHRPYATLLLDMPAAKALNRLEFHWDESDRFTRQRLEFFERARTAYLERAAREPARWFVIDADRAPGEVRRAAEAALEAIVRREGA